MSGQAISEEKQRRREWKAVGRTEIERGEEIGEPLVRMSKQKIKKQIKNSEILSQKRKKNLLFNYCLFFLLCFFRLSITYFLLTSFFNKL